MFVPPRALRYVLRLGFLALPIASASCTTPVSGERAGSVEQAVKAPLAAAYCSVVVTGKGVKAMEEDYLPRVVTCENGGASLQALKAQAIAARSVAYYEMAMYGDICDGQGCQVYTCNAQPSALAKQAVADTAGQYLAYGGMLTYAFYVDGDPKTAAPSCVGSAGYKNEKWVTYNSGLSGKSVEQTPLGFIGPAGFGQNRGCMSQWGARCLEKSGEDHLGILRFYYGEDIQLLQAEGACVTSADSDGDGLTDAEDNCPTAKNPSQLDADDDNLGDACDLDDDGDGVLDEKDNCPLQANPQQNDADSDGNGDACDAGGDDADADGVSDGNDNCPSHANPQQGDVDGDGAGDACDPDQDGDGVEDLVDDCPTIADPQQNMGDCEGSFGISGQASVQASATCAIGSRAGTTAGWGWAGLLALPVLLRRSWSRGRSFSRRTRGVAV